jgi:DNA-binding transcriptional LysR family regulator
LSALAGENLIAYARSSSAAIHDEVTAICREQRFVPNEIEEATATSRLITSVACGDGIAIVPAHWTAISTRGVVFKPMSPPNARRLRVSACWHKEETAPIVRDFVAIVQRAALSNGASTAHAFT